MLALLGLHALAGSAAGASLAPSPAPDFIHTQGRRFVDASGNDFVLHGIGLGNWLVPEGYMLRFTRALAPHEIDAVIRSLTSPAEAERFWADFRDSYITRADIDFIARAGFTAIRVPFDWKLFAADADPPVMQGPGWALIDRLLGWAREAGLRVILDMHAAPGGQTGVNHDDGVGYGLLFYVPRQERITLAVWRAIAARYANDPTVLGYDLLNEPICPYMDTDALNPRLEDFYARLAAAIRGVDAHHILFVQPPQWASNFAALTKPFDSNMAYSYHMFWASPTRDSIAPMLDFSITRNVPLWLGESGELSNAWNARFVKLQEQNGIAWSFWTYKNMQSTATVSSIDAVPDWDALTVLGDKDRAAWPVVTPAMRDRARHALAAYLQAMRFENTTVNGCYLASLGLQDPSRPLRACSAHPAHEPHSVPITPAMQTWPAAPPEK